MLQNELIDEDLEHFEDIAEDDAHETNPKQNELTKSASAPLSAGNGLNSDPLPREDGSAPAVFEGNASDEANNLLLESDKDKTNTKSILPGGYNPRHREPLYWYLSSFCCSALNIIEMSSFDCGLELY